MSLTVALAGDTMLGRSVAPHLTRPDHRLLTEELEAIARSADLFILNLECCISDRGERARDPWKRFFFRAPPVAAERLAQAGVNCATLANNHARDFGPDALQDTLHHLSAVGIAATGAGSDQAAARAPAVLEAVGMRVRVVAFSDHPPADAADADRPGIAFADLEEQALPSWVRRACAAGPDAEVVMVSPHWGPNMQAAPVPHVRRAAAALEAGGAALVAGHSAHVPQGPRGRTLFDLGDFIDDYAVDPVVRNDLGLLWLVTLDGDGPRRVVGVPVYLELAHTRLASEVETTRLLALLEERCAAVGSTVHRRDERLVFESG